MSLGALHNQRKCLTRNADKKQKRKCFVHLLQEERDFLCLPGGSDTEGQHCDEGCCEWTERDNHREVGVTETQQIGNNGSL